MLGRFVLDIWASWLQSVGCQIAPSNGFVLLKDKAVVTQMRQIVSHPASEDRGNLGAGAAEF